jgi:hypothetical protein
LLNYLGIKPPYELEGQDLMPIMAGRKDSVRDYATCGFLMNLWCNDSDYILICGLQGEYPALFDMKNDPYQHENLASDKSRIVKRLYDMILTDAGGGPILPHWGEIVQELAYRKL